MRGILKKRCGGKKGRGSHRSFEKSQLVDKLQVDKQLIDKQLVAAVSSQSLTRRVIAPS